MKRIIISLLMLGLVACGGGDNNSSVAQVNGQGYTSLNLNVLASQLDNYPLGELTALETEGLLMMREEEKLARDVYLTLYDIHNITIFVNIADSEQTHTDAVARLLERYALTDPVTDDTVGVFTDSEFTFLYDMLVSNGEISALEAFYVGAQVEELVIYDLMRLKEDVIDNDDIILVYDNLLKGSRNHLRAFYKQILNNNGAYSPQYISQELFDEIVNSDIERQ